MQQNNGQISVSFTGCSDSTNIPLKVNIYENNALYWTDTIIVDLTTVPEGFETPVSANTDNIKAYPNPFSTSANISILSEKHQPVKIDIYNRAGMKICTLFKGFVNPGKNDFKFNAENLPAGIYYYHVLLNDTVETGSLVKL